MSKSLKRVTAALENARMTVEIVEMAEGTRTASQAALAAGCHLDQIMKSMVFCAKEDGKENGRAILFLCAGGNQIDTVKASQVAGVALGKADAKLIRAQTGFAIGGVAPIGHLNPIRAFIDPRLLDFKTTWAAAGTPRHIFAVNPKDIQSLIGAITADFTQ